MTPNEKLHAFSGGTGTSSFNLEGQRLMKFVSKLAFIGASGLCALMACPQSWGIELITNGDFESGSFAGWTVSNRIGGSGNWFIDDAVGTTPESSQATVGPAGGNLYAVTDQTNSGTHALEQSFTVPGVAASVILTFDMFVNDYGGGAIVDPIGLDHTGPPNQHARVDILHPGSGPFDTSAEMIYLNLFTGADPKETNPNPYTHYEFDITPLVGAGGTYDLRFAETDNQLFFNMGIDNISIEYTPIPEPASLTLLSAIVGALLTIRRHTR